MQNDCVNLSEVYLASTGSYTRNRNPKPLPSHSSSRGSRPSLTCKSIPSGGLHHCLASTPTWLSYAMTHLQTWRLINIINARELVVHNLSQELISSTRFSKKIGGTRKITVVSPSDSIKGNGCLISCPDTIDPMQGLLASIKLCSEREIHSS